jgi:hypothetical protein
MISEPICISALKRVITVPYFDKEMLAFRIELLLHNISVAR